MFLLLTQSSFHFKCKTSLVLIAAVVTIQGLEHRAPAPRSKDFSSSGKTCLSAEYDKYSVGAKSEDRPGERTFSKFKLFNKIFSIWYKETLHPDMETASQCPDTALQNTLRNCSQKHIRERLGSEFEPGSIDNTKDSSIERHKRSSSNETSTNRTVEHNLNVIVSSTEEVLFVTSTVPAVENEDISGDNESVITSENISMHDLSTLSENGFSETYAHSANDLRPGNKSTNTELEMKIKPVVLNTEVSRLKVISIYLATLSPAPALVSVICAFISATVFSHKKLSNFAAPLIITFNIAEGCKALVFVINRTWKSVVGDTALSWSSPYTVFFSHFVIWVPDSLGRMGIVLNAIITIDRFALLTFPFKFLKRSLVGYPKAVSIVVVVSMLLWQSSTLIIFRQVAVHTLDVNTTFSLNKIVSQIALNSPRAMNLYRHLHVIASTLFRYLPLLIGLFFNTLIIIRILLIEKKRSALTAVSAAQAVKKQTNMMIVISSLVFAILVTIKPIWRIVGLLHPTIGDGKKHVYVYVIGNDIAMLLDSLTPLVNFITYVRMSSIFRECMRKMFKLPLPSGSRPSSDST